MITQFNTVYDWLYLVVLICISSGFVTYVIFSIRFYYGFKNYKAQYSYKKRTVSVIVASRNEAENLRKLLLCLINQSYPA
ncbi:MAG: hypothetical protein U1C33_02795, partial [Candidatus Cloacimonadaceae bacterium]|nr:hypothetical protein [Candidatus Cloacimonadaceae bacterium]